MLLSEKITELRKAAGLSKAALARAAKVSPGFIGNIESGVETTMSEAKAAAIANALGVDAKLVISLLPQKHPAKIKAETEVPNMGVVWASPPDEDVPAPEPGRVYKLTGRFPAETFVVRVSGDSTHNWGVHDGDVIAVRRTDQPEEGALVVARVGNAYTLKAYIGGRLYSFPKGAKEPKDLELSEPCQMVGVMLEIVEGQRRAVRRCDHERCCTVSSGTLQRHLA